MPDPRVVLEERAATHVARITLNQPEKKNCYDPPMRRAIGEAMDDVANDDDMKVLLLRGAQSIFCTGADMRNAYPWYATKGYDRRPSQRRKLAVDREIVSSYLDDIGLPRATVAQVEARSLGANSSSPSPRTSRSSARRPGSACPARGSWVPRSGNFTSSSIASGRSSPSACSSRGR